VGAATAAPTTKKARKKYAGAPLLGVVRTNAARFFGLAAACLAVWASHAAAQPSSFPVTGLPGHVVSGTAIHVTVTPRKGATKCTLGVRYAGGSTQTGLRPALVLGGHAQWLWTVPNQVQAGVARATIRCGVATLSRAFVVVGRLTTTPTPVAKVVVVKSGFTTRTDPTGSTRLNYGLILHNSSDTEDAGSITVQTNFVMADDHLLGTDTERVGAIAAGSDFAFGNTMHFPGAAPIVRLEFVITVDNYQKHQLVMPTLENIHLVPGAFQPQWLGSIEGEMQNTTPAVTLQRAQLSAVVLDGNGNIIGGTMGGFVSQPLPTGTRVFIKIGNLDVLPTDRAADAIVSIYPTWATTS
jgi:hypothetical protein